MGAPAAASAATDLGQWRHDELSRLLEQVRAAEDAAARATATLDGEVVASLWSARASDWEGAGAEAFRARCLELEQGSQEAADHARLGFAALADARATIEEELAVVFT